MKIGDNVWFFKKDSYKRGSNHCKRLDSGEIIAKRDGKYVIRASSGWLVRRKISEVAIKENI